MTGTVSETVLEAASGSNPLTLTGLIKADPVPFGPGAIIPGSKDLIPGQK